MTNEDLNLFLGNDKNKNQKQLSSMVLDTQGTRYAVSQIKKTQTIIMVYFSLAVVWCKNGARIQQHVLFILFHYIDALHMTVNLDSAKMKAEKIGGPRTIKGNLINVTEVVVQQLHLYTLVYCCVYLYVYPDKTFTSVFQGKGKVRQHQKLQQHPQYF